LDLTRPRRNIESSRPFATSMKSLQMFPAKRAIRSRRQLVTTDVKPDQISREFFEAHFPGFR
jgi:hypothetical protein